MESQNHIIFNFTSLVLFVDLLWDQKQNGRGGGRSLRPPNRSLAQLEIAPNHAAVERKSSLVIEETFRAVCGWLV
jgi:hypothetical protein